MKLIEQHSVDRAFAECRVLNLTVVRRNNKEWYFTFDVENPKTKKPETYALLTQRGKLRIWSDPRNLFSFLSERYGVDSGKFNLKEDPAHESSESDPSEGG